MRSRLRRPAGSLVVLLAVTTLPTFAACRSLPATMQGGSAPVVPPPRPGRATVRGTVSDSTTGYPVVGASIYFTADTVVGVGVARPRRDLPQATTDNSGGFALRDMPPGQYTLAMANLDHFPLRRVVVVRADEVHTIILRPARRARP